MSILSSLLQQIASGCGRKQTGPAGGTVTGLHPAGSPAAAHPSAAEDLRNHKLLNQWWYYGIELLEGVESAGAFPRDLPMLPRRLLRNCELAGTACLDLGSMEGLMPTLMCRGGATRVVATDAAEHCLEKLCAVRHYYKVDFDFRVVGLMYDLHQKLAGESFDLINCSGLLYHVVSPMDVLLGCRPLLKRNGLMIVSTNVVLAERCSMEFNDGGRLQEEANTFWYLSVKYFDYMLRFLKLQPIDCAFFPHSQIRSAVRYIADVPTGYMSVVCRTVDDVLPAPTDHWMALAMQHSWEMNGLTNWDRAGAQKPSTIPYRANPARPMDSVTGQSIDLHAAVMDSASHVTAPAPCDTQYLRLSDWN